MPVDNGPEKHESRWHAEIKAILAAVAALAVLCVALIAQTFWGNGAMLAILGVGIVVSLVIRYAPNASRTPRTH
jgi:hypothetical protein